jgi:hypothetical protein
MYNILGSIPGPNNNRKEEGREDGREGRKEGRKEENS